MKKNKKMFVSRYVPYAKKKKNGNFFVSNIIIITTLICILLTGTMVILANKIPKEEFKKIIKASFTKEERNEAEKGYVYPEPDEAVRIKADRLREIRYEDYLSRCYFPQEGEMDNVYVLDNHKKCYLTFDDGPSEMTPYLLDVLDKYKVKATFFVQGKNVNLHPKYTKAIYDAGHSIGNHTYSHIYEVIYSEKKADFKKEVTDCQNAIDNALGKKYENLIFRFPGGYDSLTKEETKKMYRDTLSEIGYKYIDWSCLTGDSNSTDPTKEDIMRTLEFSISNTKTGDIVVLMHDAETKKITVDTLPMVIEYLYSNGYEFDVLTNK